MGKLLARVSRRACKLLLADLKSEEKGMIYRNRLSTYSIDLWKPASPGSVALVSVTMIKLHKSVEVQEAGLVIDEPFRHVFQHASQGAPETLQECL